MAFGPGIHVFPGGRIDPEDGDPRLAARSVRTGPDAARALGDSLGAAEAAAIHVGAIRELFEEVGVVLADDAADPRVHRFGDGTGRLRTDLLVPIAHWTTPSFMPRRFSTWFFVADLPSGSEMTFAPDEVAGHRWMTPTAALDAMVAGELRMWVPTTSVLQRLIETGATTAAAVGERIHLTRPESPVVKLETADRLVLETFEAGGLPGRRCRTTLLGRQDVVIVDPGDASDPAIEAIRA